MKDLCAMQFFTFLILVGQFCSLQSESEFQTRIPDPGPQNSIGSAGYRIRLRKGSVFIGLLTLDPDPYSDPDPDPGVQFPDLF